MLYSCCSPWRLCLNPHSLCLAAPTFETSTAASEDAPAPEGGSFVTKTVSGYLDYTTTVGNTVMVFTSDKGGRGEYATNE